MCLWKCSSFTFSKVGKDSDLTLFFWDQSFIMTNKLRGVDGRVSGKERMGSFPPSSFGLHPSNIPPGVIVQNCPLTISSLSPFLFLLLPTSLSLLCWLYKSDPNQFTHNFSSLFTNHLYKFSFKSNSNVMLCLSFFLKLRSSCRWRVPMLVWFGCSWVRFLSKQVRSRTEEPAWLCRTHSSGEERRRGGRQHGISTTTGTTPSTRGTRPPGQHVKELMAGRGRLWRPVTRSEHLQSAK